MKKSNKFLVSAMILAFFWTILIGWFASSAINNQLNGKDPYFARSHRQYLESRKKTFPRPATGLSISGEGTAVITIVPGKELAVLAHPKLWNPVYTVLKNGTSSISLRKLTDFSDPVIITVPEVRALTLDNLSGVTVSGLKSAEMYIRCTQVLSYASDSCIMGTLTLDFPRTRDLQDIHILKSNRIDTLIASVRGSGRIRLETVGRIKNRVSLSDSVHLEATYELVKRLH
jgi:hypothetical protein